MSPETSVIAHLAIITVFFFLLTFTCDSEAATLSLTAQINECKKQVNRPNTLSNECKAVLMRVYETFGLEMDRLGFDVIRTDLTEMDHAAYVRRYLELAVEQRVIKAWVTGWSP